MAFNIGDIVLINPDAEINKGHLTVRMRRVMDDAIPLTVVKLYVEHGIAYINCKCEIDGKQHQMSLFPNRLMPYKQDIEVDCFVRCVDPRRSSVLIKGTVYKVVTMIEVDGKKLIRVASQRREIRHSFPVEMFSFYSKKAPKEWEVIVPDAWEEKLLDELSHGEHKGVCSFAIMNENGKTSFSRDAPCHAAFGYDYNDDGKKPIKAVALCFSRFYNGYNDEKKAGYKRFLNWLVNESVMKDCFIPRSADDLVRNGVLMNIKKSVDELAVAAIASRHYTEFPDKATVFDEVMEMGFEANVAMFVSTFFNKRDGSMTYNNFGGGHGFLANTLDYKSVFSFFKNGFDPELLPKPYKSMEEGRKGYKILRTVAKLSSRNEYDVGQGAIIDYVKNMKGIAAAPAGAFGGGVYKMTGKNSLIRVCAAVSKEL